MTITLAQRPYITGRDDRPYYYANAMDDNGKFYEVYWKIDHKSFFNGDDEFCNWDDYTVYPYGCSKPINAELLWY